jgi:hypothetical protein
LFGFIKERCWFVSRIFIAVVIIAIFTLTSYYIGYNIGNSNKQKTISVEDVGVQLASQTTVLCPSYMTYADQTRLEKGTGLVGVDFLYVEKKTGLDAIVLMAIAKHESSVGGVPGTNYWAKTYNNIMSLGITAVNPDRTHYATKTLNVLATAQWLVRGYLHTGAPYYHGGLTQWEIGQSYASDGSWAKGVTNAIKYYEGKLTEEQRMKRQLVKTGIFTPDVKWDYTHLVFGWGWYKTNKATVTVGR